MTFLLNTSKELATLSVTIITYRIGYQSYQNLNIGNNFSNFYGFSSSVRSSDTFFDAGLDLAYKFSCSIPMRKSKTHLLQTTSISVTVFPMIKPNISLHVSFLLPFNVLWFLRLVRFLHTTQLNNVSMVNSLDSRKTSYKLIQCPYMYRYIDRYYT